MDTIVTKPPKAKSTEYTAHSHALTFSPIMFLVLIQKMTLVFLERKQRESKEENSVSRSPKKSKKKTNGFLTWKNQVQAWNKQAADEGGELVEEGHGLGDDKGHENDGGGDPEPLCRKRRES